MISLKYVEGLVFNDYSIKMVHNNNNRNGSFFTWLATSNEGDTNGL